MANGFPKPQGEPLVPLLSVPSNSEPGVLPQPAAHLRNIDNSARAFSSSALPRARVARRSPLRSRPLLCGLALLALSGAGAGLASHTFGTQAPAVESRRAVAVRPIEAIAVSTTGRLGAPTRVPAAPAVSPTLEAEPEANAYRGVGPGVPEAYTGDPAGQALWDKTVEEDQQTLQPDDLVEEPAPAKLDLRKLPAYQALKLDADGNVNE
jgi:hypothetical protein